METSLVLSELKSGLSGLYGDRLSSLWLFGSRARGEESPDSDFDVMIVLKDKVDAGEEIARTGGVVSSLGLKYDVVPSCVYVSADRFAREQSPLFLNVRREGKQI